MGGVWALATGGRCQGLLASARGDTDEAIRSLDVALREHDRLQDPFEQARTELVLGSVLRRAKQRHAAGEVMDRALRTFERLGAPLWAERAKGEIARIGLRGGGEFGLTPTEERVAKMVTAGHTNREIADALFISVKTVEANLSRTYSKLGVRSRTELVRKLTQEQPG
jgi:DNA-binding CsgD family transcriptional regulator